MPNRIMGERIGGRSINLTEPTPVERFDSHLRILQTKLTTPTKPKAADMPAYQTLDRLKAQIIQAAKDESDWNSAYAIGGKIYAKIVQESRLDTRIHKLTTLLEELKSNRPTDGWVAKAYDRHITQVQGLIKSTKEQIDTEKQALALKEAKLQRTRDQLSKLITQKSDHSVIAQKISELTPAEQADWIIRASASRADLSQSAPGRLLARLAGQRPEIGICEMLGDISQLISQHPILAAEVAGELGFLSGILTGNESTGVALQTSLFKQRLQNRVEILLTGGDLATAFSKELEHPLTESQILALDLLRNAPYAVAAFQGVTGSSWSAQIGHWLGAALGGPKGASIGGALAGIAGLRAQRVLAESLGRDYELYVSMAETLITGPEWSKLLNDFLNGLQALSSSYETVQQTVQQGVKAGYKAGYTLFNAVKPTLEIRTTRNQREPRAHHVGKKILQGDLAGAVHESASRTLPHFLQTDAGTARVVLAFPVFVYNLAHSLKHLGIADGNTIYNFFTHIPGAHHTGDLIGYAGMAEGTVSFLETGFNWLPESWQKHLLNMGADAFQTFASLAQESTRKAYDFLIERARAVMTDEAHQVAGRLANSLFTSKP